MNPVALGVLPVLRFTPVVQPAVPSVKSVGVSETGFGMAAAPVVPAAVNVDRFGIAQSNTGARMVGCLAGAATFACAQTVRAQEVALDPVNTGTSGTLLDYALAAGMIVTAVALLAFGWEGIGPLDRLFGRGKNS
ncbi:MAG: hypothetical protein COX62_04705 [Deltaproteobacteria bacterium CG_4_10_14_0_2_um_filter_43_8]|nr:MAG: hypothetical protein COV43_05665 [Deltaproteobacteria bacterium CG11_big_fil_rev_8_21_14_0_20_42_23]PJA20437.1 MAG: hypothetical protein COX62_04705 [Deltaproteobacteria bacterium CG_4_10_14_0_2_um_filter_43_8]PJC64874.1 MAG: hypothetical protein CO021_02030 [Deltaproteobacteria bacterium CG_4_9_14_0_2_um_filter_42_21]